MKIRFWLLLRLLACLITRLYAVRMLWPWLQDRVWARDMGNDGNLEPLNYFKDRTVCTDYKSRPFSAAGKASHARSGRGASGRGQSQSLTWAHPRRFLCFVL
jgi:hypothetical protein